MSPINRNILGLRRKQAVSSVRHANWCCARSPDKADDSIVYIGPGQHCYSR